MASYYSTLAYQVSEGAAFVNVPINEVFEAPAALDVTVAALTGVTAYTVGTPLPDAVALDFVRHVAPTALAL